MATDTDASGSVGAEAVSAATDEPLPWLALEPGEEIRWRGQPRLQTVYPWLGLAVFGMIVLGAAVALEVLSILGLLWMPVLAVLPLWEYVRISKTVYVITDRRVATRRGVLGRSVDTAVLGRIQDTVVSQNAIGRTIGYGTVAIETAGGSDLAFRTIDDPLAVRARLEASADRLDGAGVPGTRAQWEDVLAEVRGWRRALERSR
jgi:membrane protein YdbS with pleckstrin-like domain